MPENLMKVKVLFNEMIALTKRIHPSGPPCIFPKIRNIVYQVRLLYPH